jgi:hypothetical protein
MSAGQTRADRAGTEKDKDRMAGSRDPAIPEEPMNGRRAGEPAVWTEA